MFQKAFIYLIFLISSFRLSAATPAEWNHIAVLLEDHCYHCHGPEDPEANLNLEALHTKPELYQNYKIWTKVEESIASGEMPPKKKLSKEDTQRITSYLNKELDKVARANAGDPGLVTVRRLTNVEYDNTIRALTGIDYQLSKDFLPDGGGGEGFSNVGDVLFVSPQQLEKYLTAARKLADHATILPGTGIQFRSTFVGPRGPEQIRDQVDQALYVWYQKISAEKLPKDGDDLREADYMLACWLHKHHELTGAVSLESLAKDMKLNPIFLQNWWNMLNTPFPVSRFLDLTRVSWRNLPPPDSNQPKIVPEEVKQRIATIQKNDRSWRDSRKVQRRQQDSDGIRAYPLGTETKGHKQVYLVLGELDDGNKGDVVFFENLNLLRKNPDPKSKSPLREPYQVWLKRQIENERKGLENAKTNSEIKPEQIQALEKRIVEYERILAKFGKSTLPGKTVKAEQLHLQAPVVLKLPLPADSLRIDGQGKLDFSAPDSDKASAQWFATTESPPDPKTVIPGHLVIWKRSTEAHRTLMGEFTVMKQAFPDEYNRRLEEITRNPTRNPANPPGKGFYPGVYYFSDNQLRQILPPAEQDRFNRLQLDRRLTRSVKLNEKDATEWDNQVRRHLHHFATLAWRRPLTPEEKTKIDQLYSITLEGDPTANREVAAREVIVRTLVAPDFIFKLEDSTQPGEHPVNAWELATRLSYFIWSAPPDQQLRKLAADHTLLKPEILKQQTLRLLKDPRCVNLAREFTGQWLEFHSFDKNSTPDANKFPEFTDELKRDMYRESIEFFTHLIREDRPITDIVLADYTFLNERLAKHYNIPGIKGSEFKKVSVSQHQRGGILGMGSLLIKNSFPHRTSPVLRGNWLLGSVLGTPTPPPPADVPELDDSAGKATSLRAKLEAHRAAAACASCHDKIDPLGFALEGFDPIGRLRSTDESGLPIDNQATAVDGTPLVGVQGLKQYLASRTPQFQSLLSKKLIGYALGRTVAPTDKVLIESMQKALNESDNRFSAAVLTLVTSRQFLNRRNE